MGATTTPSTPLDVPDTTETIVAGTTFVICRRDGDIVPGGMQGWFAADTRMLGELELLVDDAPPHALRHRRDQEELEVVGFAGDATSPHLLVTRRRRARGAG